MKNSNATLVYSSETGRISTDQKTSQKQTTINRNNPTDGTVRLQRQTKGRGGGIVIVITGLPLGVDELKDLAGALKKRCGCGGTIKDGIIEIQGDHRETLLQELQQRGFRVKLSGG
ncbi:translation initiation factor [Pelotalea chapellei]|uniref:Stress response translation initiation inhibitor YciH n=1 Tax=Pelotalea chapellei TaxID=44671 RepID=A0ABS5U3N7_9BACT|nr:stress response translation initiation inhibitor YciH [Pelotalea chapellei]MBT1070279.1 stress response translation initiation inhibitor YciH [Pelotalea chapellei]